MTTERLDLKPPAATPAFSRDELRERLLNPYPRVRLRLIGMVTLAVAVFAWGIAGTNARLGELIEGIPNIVDFITRLFPPQLEFDPTTVAIPALLQPLLGAAEWTFPMPVIIFAIIETVQMAIIGTVAAVVLSAPFGLLAARNTSPHPAVYQATRLLLNMNRAVPDIIFALIFVAAVGLGPFGGVLALAVGSIGFMGKLYAEAIEAIDPQQVLAVRATGASRLQAFLYSVVPQALPLIASYSLYLFELNIRAASILGLVGAGGVGFIISKYMSLFQYRRLMGAMILIIITVTLIDRASDYLRKKII